MLRGMSMALALTALVGAGCASSEKTQVSTGGPNTVSASSKEQVVATTANGEVPAGTTLFLHLDRKLSLKGNRVGDTFTAHVTQDILSPGGELLIPRGSVVAGRVAGLEPAGNGRPALISLAIDSIDIAGVRQPMRAEVQSTDVHRSITSRIKGRDVLIGTAGGAVLGSIIHGWQGALIGAAAGAAAGSAISLGVGDVPPELPKGTTLAVVTSRPVRSLAMLRGRAVY